ncbi:MAG: acetate kinase [Campylobacterota bacterium]|nr:acetate kinase [Campylobacterota bacterium]
MKIAVINSGSSSLKFKLFDMKTKEVLNSQLIEHIGEKGGFKNHHEALESIDIDFSLLDAIGHRVVHGGEKFHKATLIDESVVDEIEKLCSLAPLHNPANLDAILVTSKKAVGVPQIAVFDTAFHSTMPKEAYLYALDYKMYENHNIRRYGFHGTSHSFVFKEASEILQKERDKLNIITLHLGNGASVCAIKNGKSIDTSMGFTPLEGLIMGTRSGDIDPAIVLYMQRELGMSVDEVDRELNKRSGLRGICSENDVRSILESDDEKSKLALKMMIRRIQKYIGSYMALLEEVDAVVFTGGIGENSEYVRAQVMGSKMFKDLRVLVIKTDEELEIASECVNIIEFQI